MANVLDMFYHGVRQQIRRVLVAMGPDRIDDGLTAFEDGASNWSDCFFARAYPELRGSGQRPEYFLMEALNIPTIVPIRITWHTFDALNITMTKDQMRQFVSDVRDDMRPSEVMDLLRGLDMSKFESTPVEVAC